MLWSLVGCTETPTKSSLRSLASLSSFCVERKAQLNRGYLDFVGLQRYRLGGVEKSGASPSFTSWSFRFLGMSVMTT
jgi:hypothetical protein